MLMKVFVSLLFRSSAYIQLQKSLITNTSSQASKSLNDIITQNVCTLYRTNSTPSIERADVMITLQTRTCEVLSSSLGQATGYPARFFIFLLSPFMHIPRWDSVSIYRDVFQFIYYSTLYSLVTIASWSNAQEETHSTQVYLYWIRRKYFLQGTLYIP
jgi:hypothetical protein